MFIFKNQTIFHFLFIFSYSTKEIIKEKKITHSIKEDILNNFYTRLNVAFPIQ